VLAQMGVVKFRGLSFNIKPARPITDKGNRGHMHNCIWVSAINSK
jgi:hypothetical protein